jgi:arsenate reductase
VAKILFVCEHGAAKSVVAAAHFQRLARERGLDATAFARGTTPDPELRPEAVRGLALDGLAAGDPAPRTVTPPELAAASLVVTFCDLPAGLAPAAPVVQWTSPPVSEGYDAARAAIVAQVERLVAELEAAAAAELPAAT